MDRSKRYNAREKLGNMNRKVTIYTPTYQRNTLGGEKNAWTLWTTILVQVMPKAEGSNEQQIADQRVAVQSRKFRCRKLSANGLNETMILRIDGNDYDITYIEDDFYESRAHYTLITATRKTQNITPKTVLDDSLAMGYSQTFSNVTSTTVLVTAGTLPDPGTETADHFHQMVYLFRSGIRMVYGNTGSDGYSVSGNTITFVQKLRGENVLLHQYQTAGT